LHEHATTTFSSNRTMRAVLPMRLIKWCVGDDGTFVVLPRRS